MRRRGPGPMPEPRRVGFEVMARDCGQCLMTKNRIVSGERAAQIVRETRAADIHFVCHKSPSRRGVACHNHNRQIGSRGRRIGEAFGRIIWVDPQTLEQLP